MAMFFVENSATSLVENGGDFFAGRRRGLMQKQAGKFEAISCRTEKLDLMAAGIELR